MAKTRYSVTHAGQKFTRASDAGRIYTHVILCKSNRDQDVAYAKANAAATAKRDHAYYVREAGPNPEFPQIIRGPEQTAYFQHVAGLTPQQFYVELHDEAMARVNAKDYTSFWAYAWAGRPELAAKQVDKARKAGYLEVIAVPVQPIAVKARA